MPAGYTGKLQFYPPEDAATYRSGWYRVLLVADLVKQLAFQDFKLALCELRNYEPKGGIQTNANT